MATGTDHARLTSLTVDDPARVGSFELIGRLGAGGMGVVYFGRDPSGHPAAVKMVHPQYAADSGYRTRFEREVSLAQRVRGRCVSPLLAADPAADTPWLAVAYVAGPTLSSYVAEGRTLRGSDLTAFAAGLAEALAAIHREGIVHRDLKPDNVILSPEGPKVLDFGIAQALDEVSMTRTDIVVGTPGWISPERYDGHRAGPASDMFCWGGLVAYAASGRQPYGVGPVEVMRYRAVNEAPDTAEAELPAALHGVVRRALSRPPDARPGAAEAFSTITGEEVPTGADHQHLTRAATRIIDAEWSVPVDDDSAAFPSAPLRTTTAHRPITFAGHSVHTPAELAHLLREHPERAEDWLCGDGAGKLRAWLDDIGDTAFDRDYLAGIGGREQAAIAATALIAAEAPHTPPSYRGHDADIDGLHRLARGSPGDHQLLVEIVLNEISLITAAHSCGHDGCGSRCSRLERIGHEARSTIDAALLKASELGFRLGPAERDRAVAFAIETIDTPGRSAATRAVARAWPAVALGWWRSLVADALTVAPDSEEGRPKLVAVRVLARLARAGAGSAWRRALNPRTWIGPGAPRAFVLSLLLWCAAGVALGTLGMVVARDNDGAVPAGTVYAAGLTHQIGLWPVYLLVSLGVALAPARLRPGAVMYGLGLVALLSLVTPVLSRPPMLVPAFIRDPLVNGLDAMGDSGVVPVALAFPAGFALFLWLIIATMIRGQRPRPGTPLLPRQGALVRGIAASTGLGLAIWLALWGSLVVLLAFVIGVAPENVDKARGELVSLLGQFTTLFLPLSLLLGALAYGLWRRTGGHLLWIAGTAQLLLVVFLSGTMSTSDGPAFPGAGGLTMSLLGDDPAVAGWIALLVVLPTAYILGAWMSERLRYLRPERPYATPYPASTYYGTPPPGYQGHPSLPLAYGGAYGQTPPPPSSPPPSSPPPAQPWQQPPPPASPQPQTPPPPYTPPTRTGPPTNAAPPADPATRVDPDNGDEPRR